MTQRTLAAILRKAGYPKSCVVAGKRGPGWSFRRHPEGYWLIDYRGSEERYIPADAQRHVDGYAAALKAAGVQCYAKSPCVIVRRPPDE